MNSTTRAAILTVASVLLAGGYAVGARAETIVIDGRVTVKASEVSRPTGGMTMAAVEAKFGQPRVRHATVGKPPITRWDYPQFSVFFEGDWVIHSVVVDDHPART